MILEEGEHRGRRWIRCGVKIDSRGVAEVWYIGLTPNGNHGHFSRTLPECIRKIERVLNYTLLSGVYRGFHFTTIKRAAYVDGERYYCKRVAFDAIDKRLDEEEGQ